MTKSQQIPDAPQKAANQKNLMSNDPRDGSRLTEKPEAIERTPLEKKPEHDRQDQETIEAFGERGSASKE